MGLSRRSQSYPRHPSVRRKHPPSGSIRSAAIDLRLRQSICRNAALIETLPARVLLSSSLIASVLTVDGAAGDDLIIVAGNKRFVNVLTVILNDELFHYSLSAINAIHIDGGDGDDKIWIDSSLDPMAYASTIDAGNGNDSVTTGAGADHVAAGAGDDKVYTNGGKDLLDGGAGRDLLVGGYDDDTIVGGAHNDRILGQHGADKIYPGKGDDFVDAGFDEYGGNTIIDSAGTETIFAGQENDYVEFQNGTVWGGNGHDDLIGLGVASVYGMSGNDKLYGTYCDGGIGDDTITGTAGADQLHAGAGADLVKGNGGADFISGGDGNDALFGGSDSDTIYGGAGDDNLYGSDGHKDKNHADDGNDVAYGEAGFDWWEPEQAWADTDSSKADRKPVEQNYLPQDPSYGSYANFTYSGDLNLDGVIDGGDYGNIDNTLNVPIETRSLGSAGWLSSGAYDTAQGKFVPPPMSAKQRRAAGRMVVQIPSGWVLGAISTARDEIVWYRVTRQNATLPPPSGSTWVPTLAGQPTMVPNTTTGLADGVFAASPDAPSWAGDFNYDGVINAADYALAAHTTMYRFVGVKRGTVIIGGAGSAVADVVPHDVTVTQLPTKSTQQIHIAGYDRTFTPADDVIDSVPAGGPKVRGILVEGGAIWLPTDGTEPYFSSGKK